MRPPEQDVSLVLYQLECRETEDSGGDEPYMWILGFKVDADTIGPPAGTSLFPTLGVKIFEGTPASPYLLGTGSVDAPATIPIGANLGTRSFRLRPGLLPLGGWFPGLAGMIALLWEQDAFSPSTAEAGYNAFRKTFGPALSTELTRLINGDYDVPLSQDANGNVVSSPGSEPPVQWRLDRLGVASARANAVKAITANVKDQISGAITDAVVSAAGLDEKIDRDDLLGVNAQVFLGQELSSTVQDFSMDYTDHETDYTARGHAIGTRVRLAHLNSVITGAVKTFDGLTSLLMRVCWFPVRSYSATAFKVKITTRVELVNSGAEPPVAVRWFLDGAALSGAQGSVTVMFEGADKYFGPPQDVLASKYPGGASPLTYKIAGSVLEIANTGGEGVFFGTVTALYAYPGDPSLFPSPDLTFDLLRKTAYELQTDISVVGVELAMDTNYAHDVAQCKRVIQDIDRKHIAVNLGKAFVNPGDPPFSREAILDRVTADARVANAVGLRQMPSTGLLNAQREERGQ